MKYRIAAVLCSIFLIAFFLHAQTTKPQNKPSQKKPAETSYEESWKKVDSLEKLDLPKTIMPLLQGIFNKAKAETNTSQQIKSLVYIIRYQNIIEENGAEKNTRLLKAEIAKSTQPAKSIMQSILAQNLENYFVSNRWEILSRTKTTQKTPDSLSHWNAADFEREIKNHYLESISYANILKKEPVRKFEIILQTEPGSDTLRPTLYDLLAHRALNFFTSENINQTSAAATENITNLQLLADAKAFSTVSIYGLLPQLEKDDHRIQALQIYRDLIAFHIGDKNPAALTVVDLARLKYAHEILSTEAKDEAYYKAVLQVENRNAADPAGAEAGYTRAQFVKNGYRPAEFDTSISLPKIALEICEKYIAKFPNSFGGKNCAHLKSEILMKYYSFSTEKTYLPQAQLKFYLEYKNVSTIFYRLVLLPEGFPRTGVYALDSATYAALMKQNPIQQATVDVSGSGDYLQHATEIMLDKLDFGVYALMLSGNKDFTYENNQITWSKFVVTNLSAVSQSRPLERKTIIYVRDAKNGSPVKGAEVKIFKNEYNSFARKYENQLLGNKKTQKDGTIILDADNFFTLEIRKGKDFLPVDDGVYLDSYFPKHFDETRTFFFTDRSIYRPGQTVYFKGIRIKNKAENEGSEIVKNHKATVEFRDVNDQLISSEDFTTNEFGSYNGNFVIPNNLLSGNMTIRDDAGSVSIQVEEYKRPVFEVKLDTLKNSFRLNEKITQSGKAETYSGAPLDNAKVKYRVTRRANFPVWRWWKVFPISQVAEISNGSTQTDANGNFKFDFVALADPKIAKEDDPEFTYTISVDVTSQSAETQSIETSLRIGYTALRAEINVDEWLDNSTTQSIEIQTTNLSGQEVKTDGNLKIEKLKEPQNPMRERLWAKPDRPILTREEFKKHFPQDAYMEENKVNNYAVEKVLFEQKISAQTVINLDAKTIKGWPEGNYKITFSAKDTFGETVESIKYIKIYNPKAKETAVNEFFYAIPHKTQNIQPGEKAVLIIGSAANTNVHVIAEHNGKLVLDNWISLNNRQKQIEIPVTEDYRGGLFVTFTAIAENRFYQQNLKIDVPFPKKNLEITTSIWRDKTKPGAKEKWIFSIKGPDSEKVSAEMLAAMYDASLDAFLPHNWNFDLNPQINAVINTEELGFGIESGSPRMNWNKFVSEAYRRFDKLILDFHVGFYGYGQPIYMRDETTLQSVMVAKGGRMQKSENIQFAPPALKEELNAQNPLIQIRKNKQETAFFYPQLRTDDSGNVSFEFTMPDALTRWKFMAFAHTQDLKYGAYSNTLVTQKELMVQPNLPRFLYVGDALEFSANVINLSGTEQRGSVRLKLFDAYSMESISDEILENTASATQNLSLQNGETKNIRWKIKVPQGAEGIMYQLIATAGNFSDGEEGIVPVLPNRMLVTETLPMYVNGNQTKTYNFDALLKKRQSKTAEPYKLTLEIASNPAWFAVQALPYLMESGYENAEQIFNRYYANALSQHIVKSNPQIKQVFESWKNKGSLASDLEKNEELKNILLQETPWLAEGKNETDRKQRIGLLFDENNINNSLEEALTKLEQLQQKDGGWPWFQGMPTDRFITQYIITGLGRLERMGAHTAFLDRSRAMMLKAVIYMDAQMHADFDKIKKGKEKDVIPNENHLSPQIVQYFYARSYLKFVPIDSKHQYAYTFWLNESGKYWPELNLQQRAMLAVGMHQMDETKLAAKILSSIEEHAQQSEELGMYWKENLSAGQSWYQQPIETQCAIIEAFNVAWKNPGAVENMKLWLLKQKQTQNWQGTKATADAVYTLLMNNNSVLASQKKVKVFLGSYIYESAQNNEEKGTGYSKTSWKGEEIKPELGKIKLVKQEDGTAWGAMYYQYFEEIDAVKENTGALSISKSIFLKQNTKNGPVLKSISAKEPLKAGDLVTVQIRIKTDRNMEYVHVKDMRAAALEPTETLSGYTWKNGLGYYQTSQDASTSFFINYLAKGEYTFEYTLRASQAGIFTNGMAEIQCLYAPSFSGHTGSMKLEILK